MCRRLSLVANWKHLDSQPVEVNIEDLFITIEPRTTDYNTVDDVLTYIHTYIHTIQVKGVDTDACSRVALYANRRKLRRIEEKRSLKQNKTNNLNWTVLNLLSYHQRLTSPRMVGGSTHVFPCAHLCRRTIS